MHQQLLATEITIPSGTSDASAIVYCAYGLTISIEGSRSLLEHVPARLIPGARFSGTSEPDLVFQLSEKRNAEGQLAYRVCEVGGAAVSSVSIESAVRWVGIQAEQFIAENARDYIFVHAGVVGWQGRAIVIPGRTFSGKSTLVMALVEAGATYYSDEYAALDALGKVHAFPRVPRLRQTVAGELINTPVSSAGAAIREDLPALEGCLVLKTTYREGATWNPQPLTPGETWLHLLENTVAVRRETQRAITTLKYLTGSVVGAKAERPEAADVARDVLRFADAHRRS